MKCINENEPILLMHLFFNSYNFLFQIQSSSSADSPAKSRPRGQGIFSPIQCCNVYFPVGGPAFIKNTDTRRDKCVESCDPGIALRKIQCILKYLQLPNTTFLGQDYLKCRENIQRLTITCIYLTNITAFLDSSFLFRHVYTI